VSVGVVGVVVAVVVVELLLLGGGLYRLEIAGGERPPYFQVSPLNMVIY